MMATRAAFAWVVIASAVASADPHNPTDSDVDRDPHSRISLTVGLFTPTGELGFEYTYMQRYFELGMGAGVGGFGAQASLMPRLRFGDRAVNFTFGAGISGGPYHETPFFCLSEDDRCHATNATVLWANVEAGLAWMSDGGATLHLYGGAGELIGHGDCTGPRCMYIDGQKLPYFGIAIGHTL